MSVKQAVSLTVLLGASGAVWIPQLRAKSDEAGSTEQSVGADPMAVGAMTEPIQGMPTGMPTGMPAGVSMPDGPPGASAGVGAQGPSAPEGTLQDPENLEGLLGSLRTFRPAGPLELPSPESMPSIEQDPSPMASPQAGSGGLQDILVAFPLTAILRSSSGDRVVMGSRVLSAGDELVAGVSVKSVLDRAVLLDAGGVQVRVELPPLQARPRVQAQGSEDASETSAPEAAAPADAAPADAAPGA